MFITTKIVNNAVTAKIFANFAVMKAFDYMLLSVAAEAIKRHNLLSPGAAVVVGLSGGADSVALLSVLMELGYKCEALHVNYALRGDESDRDERHATEIAGRLGVTITVIRRPAAADSRRSIEMVCRDIRYSEMEKLRRRIGAEAIAVAHHREDQAETFFLNLLRGSGVAGLRGMKPKRDNIIRPLLDADRTMIEYYLASRGLSWVTDSSNNSDDYSRNRVRHNVLPALESVRSDSISRVIQSMEYLAEADELLNSLSRERREGYSARNKLDVRRLAGEESNAASLLYLILAPEGFSRSVTDSIIDAASQSESRRFSTKNGEEWELSNGFLSRISDTDEEVNLTFDYLDPKDFHPERDASTVYFDADLIGEEVLAIRHWTDGDRIDPFGMKGSRMVSDILAEAGITPSRRRKWPLLTDGNKVVWIIGVRGSRHYAVTSSTRRILRIKATRKGC